MNFVQAVQVLTDAGVEFAIIGGWSAIMHGCPPDQRFTKSRGQPQNECNRYLDFAEAFRRKFSDPANQLAAIEHADLVAQCNRVAVLASLVCGNPDSTRKTSALRLRGQRNDDNRTQSGQVVCLEDNGWPASGLLMIVFRLAKV